MSKKMVEIAKICLEHKSRGGMCSSCKNSEICDKMLEVEMARSILKELVELEKYRYSARIGLLKQLPIGQEVFFVVSERGTQTNECVEFVKKEKITLIKTDEEGTVYHTANKDFKAEDVGTKVFLTYEDAENSRKKE